jgi:hypothetical protein
MISPWLTTSTVPAESAQQQRAAKGIAKAEQPWRKEEFNVHFSFISALAREQAIRLARSAD